MKYRLLCIGRRAQDPIVEALDNYAKRLKHYVSFDVVRLKESDKTREASQLLTRLEHSDHVIALDERGASLSTAALAETVRRWQQTAPTRIVFIVGGADGLDAAVKQRAQALWSLSAMTLPHRVAHMLLVEQLYRAHSIIRGEKYHRA